MELDLRGAPAFAAARLQLLLFGLTSGLCSCMELGTVSVSRDSRGMLPPAELGPVGLDGGAAPSTPDYFLPDLVSVLPVFLVPTGQATPTAAHLARLTKHLEWARTRYSEMLGQRSTFRIADKPHVIHATGPVTAYKSFENGSPEVMADLLAHYNYNRFKLPYIFFVVVMNSVDSDPPGLGQPCNGGINSGGGYVVVSSASFDSPNFQSTMQHELGHSFGLPHVDAYEMDMFNCPSIMSYNLAHHTNHFEPSKTPGVLLAEDIRALALNDRVFPNLEFEPIKDLPSSYSIYPHVTRFGGLEIPGQVSYAVQVTTTSGEMYGSKATNMVQGDIRPDRPGITFDPDRMWHSDVTTDWVSVNVTFPLPVTLTKVTVYSQHSGSAHRAHAARIQASVGIALVDVAEQALSSSDQSVILPPTTAQAWRFFFKAGPSNMVVIRGLRFFSGEQEIFPPFVPYRVDL